MQVKSKVWLEKDGELAFGSGKYLILKTVAESGSINQAARQLGMSFRHAWSYIRSAEKRIGVPLLIKTKGGKNGGGAILTEFALDLLEKFSRLESEVKLFVDNRYKDIFKK